MKFCILRLTLLLIVTLSAQSAFGQYRVLGFVYDATEDPYIGVEVQLKGDSIRAATYTDHEGRFEFNDIARGDYRVLVITEYGLIEKPLKVRTSIEMHLQRARNIKIDEIVVNAVRAGDTEPIVQTNLTKAELQKNNLGQDVPFVLKWTPSLISTSDAGTGIGYSGIRIRGTDPTRINVTINGVPVNDAESQGVFWVDLPDFLSSTESVQIQRGVGTSTFGTGAFGASVNLNTNKTRINPYASIGTTIGSFGTYKANTQFGTGLLNNHFTIDGRLSTIQSDGYIDRGSADLKSFYLSTAYIGSKSSLRFTAFGGHEITYQAWNGVPAQYINDPVLRTYNSAGMERPDGPYEDEVDDYVQNHFQLHYNAAVFTQIQTYLTLHYTSGKGFFEQYKNRMNFDDAFEQFLEDNGLEGGDAVRRRWLDNDFYGLIGGIYYVDPSEQYDVRIGGGYNRYVGNHFGEVIWSMTGVPAGPLPNYYENDAVKRDANAFVKVNYGFGDNIRALFDLQVRGVQYEFDGRDQDGTTITDQVSHTFFNPKFGLTFDLGKGAEVFYFAGIANREPNRDDYVDSSPTSRPKAERLFDQEVGLRYANSKWSAQLNGYLMQYRDHLTITGRLNDVGEYTRQNVDEAMRIGLEAFVKYQPVDRVSMTGSATLSNNKIDEFTEFVDNWDYWNQDFENTPPELLEPLQFEASYDDASLAFSPEISGYGQVSWRFVDQAQHKVEAGFSTKFVGDQFIDNTGREQSVLPSYSYSDVQVSWQWRMKKQRSLNASLILRNIFDAAYESNAWIYRFKSADYDPRADDPYAEIESQSESLYHLKGLFPQAGRNVLFGLTLTI